MRFGLRLPTFALGSDTASLAEMGAYLRHAEDLGFESAVLIDHLLVTPPAYRTAFRCWSTAAASRRRAASRPRSRP